MSGAQLRIVKRKDKYVVQIGIDRKILFYHRKTKWIDLEEHYKWLQRYKTTRGYQPFPCTTFEKIENAEGFCENYLDSENTPSKQLMKTYNTSFRDTYWPRDIYHEMPECKPPKKEPITKKIEGTSLSVEKANQTTQEAIENLNNAFGDLKSVFLNEIKLALTRLLRK